MGLAEEVENNLSEVSIDEQGILYVPKQKKNNSSWDIVESDRVVDVSHRGVSWADDNFVSTYGRIVVGIQTLYDDVHGYVSIVEIQSRITNKRVTRELYYVIRDVFFVGERHNTIFLASVALDSFATLLTDVLHDSEPKLLPQFTTYARDMPVYYGDDAVSKLTRDCYFYFHNPDDKDRNASVYFMERPDVIV